jgi:galactokinase
LALVPREILTEFAQRFSPAQEPALYRAPGRVNLIGEHTDYNLGYVFPIALEMSCYVAVAPASHGNLRIYSRDMDAEYSLPINAVADAKPAGQWSDYVVGVARELTRDGVELQSADLYIASEVPAGSGLSSSAALEIASAVALLGTHSLAPLELALLGQRAESQFVGMPCGIMDQYASVFGRRGSAIQIDCRSLTHNYVELPAEVAVIAVNSLVKHELGTSAYRDRVAECRAAVEAIRKTDPEVQSLRDVTMQRFLEIEQNLPDVPRRRARHIISDTQRVLDLGEAAHAHDLSAMGRLFVESHRSMQYDYEITCKEIDFLVDTAIRLPGVYGSRMTGGGFGGCTVNLVDPSQVASFRQALTLAYQDRFSITPVFYDCIPAQGAERLTAPAVHRP